MPGAPGQLVASAAGTPTPTATPLRSGAALPSTPRIERSTVGPSTSVGPSSSPSAAPAAFKPGRVIVKFRPGVSAQGQTLVAADHAIDKVKEIGRTGAQLFRAEPGQELEVIQRLKASPLVEYAELEYLLRAHRTPTDEFYASSQADLGVINMPTAWDLTVGSSSITVAVIDTGLFREHPDVDTQWISISGATPAERGVFSSSSNGCAIPAFPDDDAWTTGGFTHGTHVSGTIGAESTIDGDSAIGIAGIAPGVRILPVKVLDCFGEGSFPDLVEGIDFAVSKGAKVINMSLGGNVGSCPLSTQAAINAAHLAGVLLVASAGNRSGIDPAPNPDPLSFPASCAHVISVGATNNSDAIASFSYHNSLVDLSAPGVGTTSTTRTALGNPAYTPASGTSMAAPHAAGCAALIFSINPGLTPDGVETILQQTARDIGPNGPGGPADGQNVRNDYYGYGRINCGAAVQAAAALLPPPIFTTQPSGAVTGQSLAAQPQVKVQDVNGNGLSGRTVALTVKSGTGTPGATLSCSANPLVTDSSGRATFAGCRIDRPGTAYVLTATDTTDNHATDSAAFDVTDPTPTPTATPTYTASPAPTSTPTPTLTPTATPTYTASPAPTSTPTPTLTPTATPTFTASPTPTSTASSSPTPSPSPTATVTPTGSGSISASPNPIALSSGIGSTTVSWNTNTGADGQVYVSVSGGSEVLFAQSPSGSSQAPWIAAGSTYTFRLYQGTSHAVVLAQTTVSTSASASTATPTPSPSASPTTSGGGTISASPNPVPIGSGVGSTTISWNTNTGAAGQVFVSVGGGSEVLFAQSAGGSAQAPWIVAGSTYTFRLYQGTSHTVALAQTTVTMSDAAATAISASPNPVPVGSGVGTTTITWNIASGAVGQVWVSVSGGAEVLFAQSAGGSAQAPWIVAGSAYTFRLYQGVAHTTILAHTTVTTQAQGGSLDSTSASPPADGLSEGL